MLSNDPKDILRSRIADAATPAAPKEQVKPTSSVNAEPKTEEEIHVDKLREANPLNQGFRPSAFIIGAALAFWLFVVRKYWFMLPVMIGVIMFTTDPAEAQKIVAENGLTLAGMLKTSGLSFIMTSILAVIPTWWIANKLRKGDTITSSKVTLVQIPSFFFAFLTFYHLASALAYRFLGIF